MSVILTNMNIPNSCSECKLKTRCEYGLANGWLNNKRDDNCPLKPYEERKKGKWIEVLYVGNDNYDFECSVCGFKDTHSKDVEVPFCWHCGTEMVKEGAEE